MRNVRLTDSNIKKIDKSPPSGTKTVHWDLLIRGFGAYKTSVGRISFVYQFKTNVNHTTSRKIGESGEMTVEEARAIAAGWSRDRRLGVDPFAKLKKSEEERQAAELLVIANYFEDYLARRAKSDKPISAKSERTYRRDLLAYLGEVRIDRLTTKIVDDFGNKLHARGPSMKRIGWGCLKTLINDAIFRGTIQRCEAHAFKLPTIIKRKRRIHDEEIVRVHEAGRDLGDARADAFEVLIRTCKRKEEVVEMPWEELDLAKSQWRLPGERNKSGKNKLVLLPRQVIDIIERQQPDPAKRSGPVFTLNGVTSTEFGSQVKDLIDANLHRRLELAAGDGKAPRFPHWQVRDLRKIGTTILREPPFRIPADAVNAILLHKIGDDLDETYMLTELVESAGEALQAWNDHYDSLVSVDSAWPGGRELPSMPPAEETRRAELLREGWPKREDQKRAEVARAANPAPPGSTSASAARQRRARMLKKKTADK